jgi:capsular exopolysaccharide synthesis family protein
LRTLLVDADLRRPGLAPLFPGVPKDKGLSSCLAGFAALPEASYPSGFENLTILPAGPTPPNPAELLAADDFGQLLEAAGQHFDHIVIDTAPVNVVSDTLLIASHASEVCFVVRARKTSLRKIERAQHLLRMAECRPVGFVLNLMPGGAAFAYHSYYEGEYGSPGVYGATARSATKS